MLFLWNTLIYQPIYNALIAISQAVLGDVGIGVIILTIIIRLALFPLSKRSIISQYKMRSLEPKIQAIREKQLPKQEESQALFALYREEKINPFSGCLYLLIQLPILFALYFTFMHGVLQPEHLYSFLSTDGLRATLLGVIDLTKPSLILAIIAGIAQGLQAFLAPQPNTPGGGGFQQQFAKSMSTQTKYILPIIIIFIANRLASAVSLYWTVTNLFSVGQELYMRKKYKHLRVESAK
jgi:YidC/Oxa1 family membrane protein insertase